MFKIVKYAPVWILLKIDEHSGFHSHFKYMYMPSFNALQLAEQKW